jgi:hypothetical protein
MIDFYSRQIAILQLISICLLLGRVRSENISFKNRQNLKVTNHARLAPLFTTESLSRVNIL